MRVNLNNYFQYTGDESLIFSSCDSRQISIYKSYTKRLIDIVLVFSTMPLILPIIGIAAFFIKLESKGPVFFKQKRVGKNGEEFNFYKLRSMIIDAEKTKKDLIKENESRDGVIFKMKDDPRVTKVGKFIRKYSIDELPQLFNVLKGDMSMVGPRPPVPSEVKEYTSDDRKRLAVTPGITCIWQVSGRSLIPFKKQVQMDKDYISKISFFEDMKLLFKTVPAIVSGNGAY